MYIMGWRRQSIYFVTWLSYLLCNMLKFVIVILILHLELTILSCAALHNREIFHNPDYINDEAFVRVWHFALFM